MQKAYTDKGYYGRPNRTFLSFNGIEANLFDPTLEKKHLQTKEKCRE
jgi:hypothetical protein